VPENRLLWRIFVSKRSEVMGRWRKVHNEELHGLYYSPSIIRMTESRRMRRVRQVARLGRMNAYRLLVGKPEVKRPLGRPKWWVDNIMMNLPEMW
jgi:hypothetical protein